MAKKLNKDAYLLWIDLEMTGLDPEKDLVLEVAAELTDFNFRSIKSYESLVFQPKEEVIKLMAANSWWQEYPKNRNSFLDNIKFAKKIEDTQIDLLELINDLPNSIVYLAGNSIHLDRKFIAKFFPELDSRLHYRMLDVSSFKILFQEKYGKVFEKSNVHRAFDDIQASIAEIRHYLKYIKTDEK